MKFYIELIQVYGILFKIMAALLSILLFLMHIGAEEINFRGGDFMNKLQVNKGLI